MFERIRRRIVGELPSVAHSHALIQEVETCGATSPMPGVIAVIAIFAITAAAVGYGGELLQQLLG